MPMLIALIVLAVLVVAFLVVAGLRARRAGDAPPTEEEPTGARRWRRYWRWIRPTP